MSEIDRQVQSIRCSEKELIKDQKQRMRKIFLDRRNKFVSEKMNLQRASKQASQCALSYLRDQSGFWASYRPIHTEFDPLNIELDNKHLTWVYPKIKNHGGSDKINHSHIMEFRYPHQLIWQKNLWGIEEPSDQYSEAIATKDLQGIFCPAVAVDLKGHRLGYGKGYYDRALSHFKGEKIALVFSVQISKQLLPQGQNDVVMDWILTESEFLRCKN